LLALNPHVEARLHQEVDAVLAGGLPTLAHVPRLDYARRVLSESLRMIPPVPATGRMALEDDVICGHFLPRNARVFLSNWPVHHDPRWYPQPERFDPERFTPEAVRARPRLAYFPFGGGTHLCVGKPFSELTAAVLLSAIAQRYRLRLNPNQKVEMMESMTIQPKGGLPMKLERRP
jgi:cytochrome P450